MSPEKVTALCRSIIRAGRACEELEPGCNDAVLLGAKQQVKRASIEAVKMLASIEQRKLFAGDDVELTPASDRS